MQEKEYSLPPSVFEYHISNPDVEHHNSYATFIIDGQNIDCFTDFVTTRHFEQEGDNFFGCSTTALVPVDGSDTYINPFFALPDPGMRYRRVQCSEITDLYL